MLRDLKNNFTRARLLQRLRRYHPGSISCGSTGRTGNVAKAPCKSPNGSTSKIVGKELIKMMGSSQDCPFSFGI